MFDLQVDENDTGMNSEAISGINKSDKMNSLKSNLLYSPAILTGMSHEVRTHMNAIVAFSFLIKENGCNSSEKEDFSNQIFNSCDQLIKLFDSFLDSAIIDTGKSKADTKKHKLDDLLDELFTEFREVINKDLNKELDLITEVQLNNTAEVCLDKERVSRIIRCLFQNSLRNTKSGYIKIGYNFSDDNVNFYVIDSGQGYFKFKEFLQTQDMCESLSEDNDTSTAINIILSKNLLQMLGGTIRIECNGLTGSGIYFSVPSKIISNTDFNINNYVTSMIAI
jgi:K+-sensing histidine kinase KdpD